MAADKETAIDHNMFLFYPRPSASSAVLLFLVVANGHIVGLCIFALKKITAMIAYCSESPCLCGSVQRNLWLRLRRARYFVVATVENAG